MLNSSVSLGRAGIPVDLISGFADDSVGKIMYDHLRENNIGTEHLWRYRGRSPLALAFLDEENDAEYEFYEDVPEERPDINIPVFSEKDILMFGSIMASKIKNRTEIEKILSLAEKAGSNIIYDPNFRSSNLPLPGKIKPLIVQNIACSDVVRASDEDMEHIHDCHGPDEAYEFIRNNGCNILIYTSGPHGVHLKTPSFSRYYRVPSIEPVSTVGAGDSFNAGIAYMLHTEKISCLQDVPDSLWDRIIGKSIEFATNTCMNTGNYISPDFAGGLKRI